MIWQEMLNNRRTIQKYLPRCMQDSIARAIVMRGDFYYHVMQEDYAMDRAHITIVGEGDTHA